MNGFRLDKPTRPSFPRGPLSPAGLLMLVVCLLAGCGGEPRASALRDLRELPQDCMAYLDARKSTQPLIPPDRHARCYEQFQRALLAPWRQGGALTAAQARAPFEAHAKQPQYGENGQLHWPEWAGQLQQAAGLESFPNDHRKAITVRNSCLRELPTLRPCFKDFYKPGDGYPFDTLQSSAVWAGSPVLVRHVSREGDWVLAETALGAGWMPAGDVAFVDEEFVKLWRGLPLAAVVKDDVPVREASGPFRFRAHIGTVLPLAGRTGEHVEVVIPFRKADGQAVGQLAMLSADDVAAMPMTPTPQAIAELANRMLGQAYGWGGMYEDRDCSSTTHDLFAPFGLWLPRNSAEQARAGEVVPLNDLPPGRREQIVLERGVPMLTLVRPSGHIALYIGRRNGRAVVLHNTWGLKTRQAGGGEGRLVVGRCVISTLRLGEEVPAVLRESVPLNRTECMVLLGGGAEGRP